MHKTCLLLEFTITVAKIFCDLEKYKLILEDKPEFSWEKE